MDTIIIRYLLKKYSWKILLQSNTVLRVTNNGYSSIFYSIKCSKSYDFYRPHHF